jgi:phage portal protein BeeE
VNPENEHQVPLEVEMTNVVDDHSKFNDNIVVDPVLAAKNNENQPLINEEGQQLQDQNVDNNAQNLVHEPPPTSSQINIE